MMGKREWRKMPEFVLTSSNMFTGENDSEKRR
jgi:hypothetical protein